MVASPTPTTYQRQPTRKTAMNTAITRTAPRRSSRSDVAGRSVFIEGPLGGHRRLAGDLLEVGQPADHEPTPGHLAVVLVLDLGREQRVAAVGRLDGDLGRRRFEQAERGQRDLRGALDVALALPGERSHRGAAVVLRIVG